MLVRSIILRKPIPLRPGDRVAVIAPSSPFEVSHLEKGLDWLRSCGYEPVLGQNVFARHRYLAGSDSERLADLRWALADPTIAGVICARGGYGAMRLLEHLDPSSLQHVACRPFLGFSDVTALHLWLQRNCGWVTLHGPMVGTQFAGEGFDEVTADSMREALAGRVGGISVPDSVVVRGGVARGRLVGGNLALLCASLGTSFEPLTDDAILFLEDIYEAPYRVDRMLTQLRLSGRLHRVRGIVVGEMIRCEPPAGADYTVDDVIADRLGDLGVPMLTRFPLSHGQPNHTVALGLEYELTADPPALCPLEPLTP